jgi:hypothetical protein
MSQKRSPSAAKILRLVGVKHLQSRLNETRDLLEADVIDYLESLSATKRVKLEAAVTSDGRMIILADVPGPATPPASKGHTVIGTLKCVLCRGGSYRRSKIERSDHWRIDAHIDTKRKIGATLYRQLGVNL